MLQRIRLLVVVLALGATAAGCDSGVTTYRGEVTSVEQTPEQCVGEKCVITRICFRKNGQGISGDVGCLKGALRGTLPEVGDCVNLTIQAESSMLKVEETKGCT